ncbi:isocitrate dehydrogenase [NAD] catalytic subunit 5 mitochondrial [Phtheirospermum japonicum]|uniref:Isocitrate dehydrogenase [NAD] catalytic subunit 5 mitochondrial n=1 Tax=Phtheirospermum japonicum TaxID=374723 RepID=A0A830CDZ7_9LAMI|nr:isocitrate dehydrogenase [NAD] catalytic subunit 5 mitochondrial [Phtheirospermum japonicum]
MYSLIDAFTDSAFKGNPAAVFLLEEERDEEWLQAVAREFNLSETCYLTRLSEPAQSTIGSVPRFGLRWFTPVAEVKLCGHATLAASHFLFSHDLVKSNTVEFTTLSGILAAKRVPDSSNGNASDNFIIELDFPVDTVMEYNGAADVSTVSKSLNGASVNEILNTTGDDLLVVLPSGEAVVETEPNFDEIRKFPGRGMIITGLAPTGSGFDFFSRFFCPKLGINEDPVTGSANCALAVYWSKKLGKCDLIAYQASARSGVLDLHHDVKNQRVLLRGKAVAVMEGSLLEEAERGFVVADCSQRVVFWVNGRGILGQKDELILRDDEGNTLLLIRRKGGIIEAVSLTRQCIPRVVEYAFYYAKTHGRQRVSAIHKANIMQKTDGLFHKCCREVSEKYPEIKYEEVVINNCCMMLVKYPALFDVLVMPNLYGDIISDLCADLIGGLGLTPSCNIGEGGIALAEAVHGSAPDIAGKNLANPTALLLSAVTTLCHLDLHDKADRIQDVVLKTIAEEKYRTGDLGGNSTTTDFTKAICDHL